MPRPRSIAIACVLLSLVVVGTGYPQATDVIPNRYIVQFEDFIGDPDTAASRVAAAHGGRVLAVYRHAMRGAAFVVPRGIGIADLQADPFVRRVEPDRVLRVPAPPRAAAKPPWAGGGGGDSEVIPTGIRRIGADLNPTEGAPFITVAVLDTGIDLDHPDLAANIWGGVDFTLETDDGDDNNKGFAKGHGTHVAGVIAAIKGNNTGVVGVGAELGLFSVKVLGGSGGGSLASIVLGVDWLTLNADFFSVGNMSFGGRFCSDLLQIVIDEATAAGVTLVAASGNDGLDMYGDGNPLTCADNFYPAAYDNVIAVSALDDRDGTPANDAFAWFSNHGAGIDLIAPGVEILSTANNGKTSSLNGTSFASPHVAGAAALWLYFQPQWPNRPGKAQVLQALIDNAEAAPAGGWLGDPDGIDEPLVNANAAALGGTGS